MAEMEVQYLLPTPAALAPISSDLKSLHPTQQDSALDNGQEAGAGGEEGAHG